MKTKNIIISVLKSFKFLWSFYLIIFFMNAFLFDSEYPLFNFWIFTLTKNGIFQGLKVCLGTCIAVIIGNILVIAISPQKLIHGISFILSPLKLIKLPVRNISLMLGIALEFIPILINESKMILKAQKARGAIIGKGNRNSRIYSNLAISVFIAAFRRADELSKAMEARGF